MDLVVFFLTPKYPIKYLFVGTFNPEWNNPNGNNANWFYGRKTNSFWNIMPRVFNGENLNNITNRNNPEIWKRFCLENKIGISDLVSSISNLNFDSDFENVISFNDDFIETKNLIFTDICNLININAKTLCGVYFTRYIRGLNPHGQFLAKWLEIQNLCIDLNIESVMIVKYSNLTTN